jgi:DMSO/TMAO reductase YedYZ molybdopterin-dependent catalytic subunit
MKKSAAAWALAGIVAGFAGLAVDFALAEWWNQKHALVAVADFVVLHAPADLVNWGRENHGKALTIPGTLVVLAVLFGLIGRLSRTRWWGAVAGYGAVALVGVVAILDSTTGQLAQLLALAIGFAVMSVSMSLMAERLRRLQDVDDEDVYGEKWRTRRRGFLAVAGAVAAVAGISTLVGRFAGGDKRAVQDERKTARLPATKPVVPEGARLDVEGVQPWMTPVDDFYLIDTAFSKPAILAKDWELRIHGMVEREITLSYNDLVAREGAEAWITLNCVSNEVGGDLVGNAWWSGVLLAPILAEAGPLPGADCVVQTSADGWNCATPLAALTDGRMAMLAVAMNGESLTIEHGYPVRTIVPGLYGYVSGTKWVVDMELSTFEDVDAYWTQRGWSELGPVKIASRVDVPRGGDEVGLDDDGNVVLAGTAWHQHTGIEKVEVQVDGGAWMATDLGQVPNEDTWVQWRATVALEPGEHTVQVRATGADGAVQTGAVADVIPDGATGWHSVDFTVA